MPQPPTQKFLFNRSFDSLSAEAEAAKAPPPPTFSEAELQAARAEAEQRGFAAGEQAAEEKQQAQILALLTRLTAALEGLVQQAGAQQAAQQTDIGDIALTIARKLLPDFMAEQTLGHISALLSQVCHAMTQEPRLVVRVPDSLLDPLQQQLAAITQASAYAGKVVLLADATLPATDCKIEWADGGIEFSSASLWQKIDEAVRQAKALPTSSSSPSPRVQE